jgi:hypothetical protein
MKDVNEGIENSQGRACIHPESLLRRPHVCRVTLLPSIVQLLLEQNCIFRFALSREGETFGHDKADADPFDESARGQKDSDGSGDPRLLI